MIKFPAPHINFGDFTMFASPLKNSAHSSTCAEFYLSLDLVHIQGFIDEVCTGMWKKGEFLPHLFFDHSAKHTAVVLAAQREYRCPSTKGACTRHN
jgi:hypothetical protein